MNSEHKNRNQEDRKVVIENNRLEGNVLFAGQKELIILHNEEEYRLRITGNNKLILTK